MIRKKELLERIESLEQENYKFNKILKDNYDRSKCYTYEPIRCDTFVPYNPEDMFTYTPKLEKEIISLTNKINEQEQIIKELVELCRPLIEEKKLKSINEDLQFNFDLIKFAKDLFMPEKTQKKAKSSEKTKAKCECEKKSYKKGGKE